MIIQVFSSISVNSGFENIRVSTSMSVNILPDYSPRFQREIVNYHLVFVAAREGQSKDGNFAATILDTTIVVKHK